MTMFRCFSIPSERKVKNKGNGKSSKENFNAALAKLQNSTVSSEVRESVPITFDVRVPHHGVQKSSRFNVRVMSLESPVKAEVEEAYEGEDENDDSPLIKRELSDFVLQIHEAAAGKDGDALTDEQMNEGTDELEDRIDRYSQKSADNQTGHVSDPGIGKSDFLASPKLKRSCSNLENRYVLKKIAQYLPPSQSFEDLQELSANPIVNFERSRSVMSHCSADRVMLKRRSASQVLPSGSKKLWWKLLLWSHRNIHRPFSGKSKLITASGSLSAQCGYTSDTLEPKQSKALKHVGSSESIDLQSFDRIIDGDDDQMRGKFQNEDSGFCPQNQWFALSTESSSLAWVDAWLKDLEIQEPLPEDNFDDDNDNDRSIAFPPSPDAGKTMKRSTSQLSFPNANPSKEILNANNVVQSLNPASSVAHISGVGIKAIPVISHLSNLCALNLSNNFIVSIAPGCLPRSIQALNLSRNKISTVEGLRELTRLRVLDLSYNRISRIGQGLSSCTLIKELYIAGNRISDVEGLHRLFKLTVLDLSFNKITTTKALGQLVTNYNSIQDLNLLGNPIQRNISDEQLKKAVCGLLPNLTYLNKQPLKAQRPREILTDSFAKAALGNIKRSSGRRQLKRVGQGGSSSRGYRSSAGVSEKSRNRIRR